MTSKSLSERSRGLRPVPRHGRLAGRAAPGFRRRGATSSVRIFRRPVDKLVARLREHDVGETAPKPGEPMPHFVLPDEAGQLVSLDTLLEKGPVAVTFHRGHWCPYCRINTRALAEAQDADRGRGRADRSHHARPGAFHRRAQGRVRRAVPDPHRHRQRLRDVAQSRLLGRRRDAGADDRRGLGRVALARSNTWLLPIPATFVVGTDGEVKARFVDPDYRKRMTIEDLIAALKSAQ